MVGRANATSEADECASNEVADPDAQPRLPPRQAGDDHGRRDHPRVDVERVGDPEPDKVPRAPLAPLRLDGFEIMVRELCAAATWLAMLALAPGDRRASEERMASGESLP